MSMYQQLFGWNKDKDAILNIIGLSDNYIARFRDVDVVDSGSKIKVLARIGGNNRKDYQEAWNMIRSNKYYLYDEDDSFDSTYAYILFYVPFQSLTTANKYYHGEPMSLKEKFDKEIADMDDPNSDASMRAKVIANHIMNSIENGNHIIEL